MLKMLSSNFFLRIRSFVSSIRFRIATLYSLTIFSLAAIALGLIYWLISRQLGGEQLFRRPVIIYPNNQAAVEDDLFVARLEQIEELGDERALEILRDYSLIALGVLFVASLIAGWIISGSTLRPIRNITMVAKQIQSNQDLSHRINQKGPPDELKELADTFDEMLESLDILVGEKIQALEANRNFIKESSHEIRNPLQVIRTNLQVTLNDENATSEDYRETMEIINKTIDRISVVIDELTQSEHYQINHEGYEVMDLSDLVLELGEEFDKVARAKGITLKVFPEKAEIKGDGIILKQAVVNLLDNAMEALEKPVPKAKRKSNFDDSGPHIYLSSELQNGTAFLKVEDNGPGIRPEDRDRIFVREQRGGGKSQSGRGLGLTIVRQVAEAHGGKVEMSSEPDEKTIFSIHLPSVNSQII